MRFFSFVYNPYQNIQLFHNDYKLYLIENKK